MTVEEPVAPTRSESRLSHGGAARLYLPDERQECDALEQRLAARFAPADEVQALLVRRMAYLSVRLRRIMNSDLLSAEALQAFMESPDPALHLNPLVHRYDSATYNALVKALHELQRLQSLAAEKPPPQGIRIVDVNY